MPTEEIEHLLESILVFEPGFKKEILSKSRSLGEDKLLELKNILLEVGRWQKITLDKITKDEPSFMVKIENAKRKTEKEVMDLYKQKLEKADREKMEIILGKISKYE
ncbi:MAG: hypothetical protein A2534_01545 [Candidatus Magasanikbacteria bacterium RIFOXYD2_FULL_39_9]|uniref:Uncharacterized protein n=1 Tax=Candidatus Magasanikbacteria bacterium RIFOXYD1_FULL_40_23 TaxID=1798705 RepID=A0A1F6P7C1_9BACT|nr:MAG: hypothetical protein A2563_00545 [Candidatus Magasanikbacteria bacterium RIFOXYD1_FULL_40_23]OGH93519.1 MAG: hypothetical protein A2534_01545 [Candidatus Magasanikbacteria bacterium RIFOXYD2_FULL_39_9]